MTILIGNILLFCGAVLFLDGIRAFREFPRLLRFYFVATLMYATGQVWFLTFGDLPNVRTAVRSGLLGTVIVMAAVAMASRVSPRDRGVYWGTAGVFALCAGTVYARGFAALLGPATVVLQPRRLDLLTLITLDLAALGCVFGLAMAANLRLQRRTEQLALFDALTNLPNRRLFEERLEEAGRNAVATGQRIGLIYCDLDDFKAINDTLGHEGGDKALRIVADRMREFIGEKDCLARVGGDEFLVLLEDAPSRGDILALIERLKAAVEGDIGLEGRTARLRISCGLAIFPEDVGSAADLIRLADAAMYAIKQHGRLFAA